MMNKLLLVYVYAVVFQIDVFLFIFIYWTTWYFWRIFICVCPLTIAYIWVGFLWNIYIQQTLHHTNLPVLNILNYYDIPLLITLKYYCSPIFIYFPGWFVKISATNSDTDFTCHWRKPFIISPCTHLDTCCATNHITHNSDKQQVQ